MIGDFFDGCFERFGNWLLGAIFLILAIVVLVRAPSSAQTTLSILLSFVMLQTSAMFIVGFGLNRAKRLLAISWVAGLVAFLVSAALLVPG